MKWFFLFLFFARSLLPIPQYYCTGATPNYFLPLLNLIGSLYSSNGREIQGIAVFDFGLRADQIDLLRKIPRVSICQLQKTDPEILNYFYLPNGRAVFGWFAWKAVAIKQALEQFPYVLWLDAGTTVLKPLDALFSYIQKEGYFLCTIGDDRGPDGLPLHSVGWGITHYVRRKFHLDDLERRWILERESIMGGVIGVAKESQRLFLDDLYEFSKDLRNYADDGTAPNGWGSARHDQTLLSILAYSRGLQVHRQDPMQKTPIFLGTEPFYITWDRQFVTSQTSIYSSRGDLSHFSEYWALLQNRITENAPAQKPSEF